MRLVDILKDKYQKEKRTLTNVVSKVRAATQPVQRVVQPVVSDFKTGMNLKQPKNVPLSLAQDTFRGESAKRVFSREGLGSRGGIREAGKGVLRTGVTAVDTARKLNPGYYIQPQKVKVQQNKFKDDILNRLSPRGNDVQKSLNKGFEFSSQMAGYGPIEDAALKVAGSVPKVANVLNKSGVARFATRRLADVISGQALASQQDIKNAGGGFKGRAVIAGTDLVGGTAMEGAGKAAGKVGEKIRLKGADISASQLLDRPIRDVNTKMVGDIQVNSPRRDLVPVEVPNSKVRGTVNGTNIHNDYKAPEGTTTIWRTKDGKIESIVPDSDEMRGHIKGFAMKGGFARVPGADALSNEAKNFGNITNTSNGKFVAYDTVRNERLYKPNSKNADIQYFDTQQEARNALDKVFKEKYASKNTPNSPLNTPSTPSSALSNEARATKFYDDIKQSESAAKRAFAENKKLESKYLGKPKAQVNLTDAEKKAIDKQYNANVKIYQDHYEKYGSFDTGSGTLRLTDQNGKAIEPGSKFQPLSPQSTPSALSNEATPKTARVWIKSKFSNDGAYADIPIIRKEENITLYQGGKTGDQRQFWTPDKKYAEQFGNVKKKTGAFYQVDNGNRMTNVYVEAPPQSTQGTTTPLKATRTGKGIRLPLKDKKATEAINTRNFAISDKGKANLKETVEAIKPELEKVKGGVLKNEEVVDAAKASKILSREVNPEATKKATAAVTRLRQEVAAGAEGKGLTKDFIENLKVLKSYSADAGRKLQAFNIKASPETSIKESIIADLVGLGKKSDDLIKAAKGVDFDNPKQVSKFYRQFVKPSLGEVLDEYRYINLLSSPQTHIVNAFSNLIQGTVLNPATKLYTGAIDSIGSTLTGKQRTAYMREVPAYSKGFINSMGEAFKEASEVMKGNKFVERPDINRLSTGKLGPGEYVMRALEAGDVFFRKMIKGGEMEALAYKASRSGKKIPKSVMEKQAADAAEYFVFRKAPDPTNKTGQGAVLSGIDKATEAVYKFRNVPGVKWVIPFVQTPMNILKQGLEYSPLGVSTMVGNTNKTQQLAKALIGSTVLAGAATLESTWDAPTSKNEKEEFYASGRKPYSVKIGDNWVSYSKLGPLAYPMAMAAAVKWYFENDPKATSTDSIDKTTKLLGGIAGFFSDQSYLSGIGDLVDVAKGEDYAIKGMLANFGKQLVPLTSLQGWVARQLDPIYRQPKTITEQIKTGIPGLSKSVDSYKDPLGNDSVRQNNTFNSWSPVNVNPANQQFEDIYQKRQLQKRSDAEAKALTSGSKTLSDGRVAVVINDEVKKFDSQQEADQAINKEKFKNSDKKAELIDGTYYYKKSDGDVGTYTEQEYNYKLRNAKMDIAYNKKDYKGWVQLANEKLKDIEKQYNEADPLTQQELLNDYQDLAAKIAKYAGYGGFTKPKTASKGKKITAKITADTFASFKPKISLVKPQLKAMKVSATNGGFKRPQATRKAGSVRLKRGV